MTAGRVCGGAAGGGGVPLTVIGSYGTKYASQVYLSNNWEKKEKKRPIHKQLKVNVVLTHSHPKKGFQGLSS